MNTPTLNDAKELIGLAQRMGIPTKDAISGVVMRMAEPRRFEEYVVERGRLISRTSA